MKNLVYKGITNGILFIAFYSVMIGNVFAQDTLIYPIQNSNDPTQTQPQSFDLGDPKSVKQTIVYDPTTGSYIFRETIGNNLDFRNPSMMTLEEYIKY